MNHLDLFSGIGGFSLAIEKAGIKPSWVGYSDINTYANNIFRRHFNEAEELGGIESVQPRDLPRLDLVTFGFPCQDLSVAGKRGGLQASRSGLFFEAMRIIRAKRPRYIIFENVKGLLSSNGGYDFILCLQEIANAGYDGQWQLLNTRWFPTTPQNRERIFFVGHLRGERRPEVFPIGCEHEENNEIRKAATNTITAGQQRYDQGSFIIENRQNREAKIINDDTYSKEWSSVSPALMARDYKTPKVVKIIDKSGREKSNQDHAACLQGGGHSGGNHSDMDLLQIGKVCDGDAGRVFDPKGAACTLKAEGGGWGAKTGLYKIKVLENLKGEDGHECHNVHDPNGIAPTVRENHGKITMIKQSKIRRLTPTECERLQGFPDGWTDGQSDTQRYKQLGNAVSVPVVKSIIERIEF